MSDEINLTLREHRKLEMDGNFPLVVCPCCRRYVVKCEAHSILDFAVKICKSCTLQEKMSPEFNWIIDTNNNFF